MATSTLNTANTNPAITLSSGNLKAVHTAASSTALSMGTPVLTSGKWYWEETITTIAGGTTVMVGLAINFSSPSSVLGTQNGTIGYGSDGNVNINNSNVGTIATYATGSVVSVAVDIANQLIWFRVNGGNWNNNIANNPVTSVGGISITAALNYSNSSLLPTIGTATLNDSVTVNFGATGFSFTAPTGYASANTWSVTAALSPDQKVQPIDGYTSLPSTAKCFWQGSQYVNDRFYTSTLINQNISGTVKEGTTPVAKVVALYDNVTYQYLGQALSDPTTGAFSIPALGRAQVFAVAFDPTTFQAQVYDRLTPV